MRAVNCSDFVMDLSVARCAWLCSSSHCPPVFFSPLWRETNFFVPWHSLSRRSITRGHIVHSKRLAHVDESRNVFPFLSSRPRSSIRVLRDILNSASVARDNVRNNAIGNISAHSRALEIFEGDKGGKGASAFANGDCTQCVHVGAAIPQLVTYIPFVAGGRWRSRALPSFTLSPYNLNFCANPFIRTADDGSFHSDEAFQSRNSSTSSASTATTKNRKDELTFDLCKTLYYTKVLATRSSTTSKGWTSSSIWPMFSLEKSCTYAELNNVVWV